MRLEADAVAELRIPHDAARADVHVIAEDHPALQDHVDVEERVAARADVAADIEPRRIRHGHAGRHQRPDEPALECALEVGELGAVVHAGDFQRVVHAQAGDRHAVGDGHRHGVGQVVLGLGVLRAEPVEPRGEQPLRRRHDAGVDLPDGTLALVGITVLDDARDLTVLPDDSAELRRVFQGGSDDGETPGRRLPGGILEHAPADQRHVAVHHQHDRIVGDVGHGLSDRVARAEAL